MSNQSRWNFGWLLISLVGAIGLSAALSGCDGDSNGSNRPPSTAQPAAPTLAANWTIGPIVSGENKSRGTPLHPAQTPEGLSIPIGPDTEPHYVTFRHGSLLGKSRIVMRYKVVAPEGTIIYPKCCPLAPATLTAYFQRAGDNWSGSGNYESYRWWATPQAQALMPNVEYTQEISLDSGWTAVVFNSSESNSSGFLLAKQQADAVGFTLGGGDGYGHGIRATAPAQLIIMDYRVE